MDIVYIRDLTVHTVIGVHDWERTAPRPLILNLEMASDFSAAAKSDDIADALDYYSVSEALLEFAKNSHFELIESFAEGAAQTIRERFAVPWLRLDIAKPGAVGAAVSVGVRIERGKLSN